MAVTVDTTNKKNTGLRDLAGTAGETQDLTAVSHSGSGNARLGIALAASYDATLADISPHYFLYDPAGESHLGRAIARWTSDRGTGADPRQTATLYAYPGSAIGASKTLRSVFNGSQDNGTDFLMEGGITLEGVAINRVSVVEWAQGSGVDVTINVPANGAAICVAMSDNGAALTLDSGGTLITNHADWDTTAAQANTAWAFFEQGGTGGNNTFAWTGQTGCFAIAFYPDTDDVTTTIDISEPMLWERAGPLGGSSWSPTNVDYTPTARSDRALECIVMMQDGGIVGVTDTECVSGVVLNPGASEESFVLVERVAVLDVNIWVGYILDANLPSAAGGPYDVRVDFNGSVTRDDIIVILQEKAGVDQTTPTGQTVSNRTATTGDHVTGTLSSVTAGSVVSVAGAWVDDRYGLSRDGEYFAMQFHDDDNSLFGCSWGNIPVGSTSQLTYGYDLLSSEPDPHIAVVEWLEASGGGPFTINTGLALETDTAFGITGAKVKAVGLAPETDTALAPTIDRALEVGLALESDTAFVVVIDRALLMGLAPETDIAFPLAGEIVQAIGLASETDTAFAVGIDRALAVGLAPETDAALALASITRTVILGLAVEVDLAFPLVGVSPPTVGGMIPMWRRRRW